MGTSTGTGSHNLGTNTGVGATTGTGTNTGGNNLGTTTGTGMGTSTGTGSHNLGTNTGVGATTGTGANTGGHNLGTTTGTGMGTSTGTGSHNLGNTTGMGTSTNTGGHNLGTNTGGHNLGSTTGTGSNLGGNSSGHNAGWLTSGHNVGGNTGGNSGGHNAGGNAGGHNAGSGGGGIGSVGHNNAIHTLPSSNSHEHNLAGGNAIRTRGDGHISDVHDAHRGMDIHHGLAGGRSISIEHADHSRSFYERGRPGFVQHPYSFHGHDFARRTYVYRGHTYSHFYRGYGYHGVFLNLYAPSFFFHPAYYGWAYRPWGAPVYYHWGWGGAPWYARYNYYFSPYPSYPSAAYWLTDYIVAQQLQAAYNAQVEAGVNYGGGVAGGGQPLLTSDVKQMIADEVRNQLALEGQQAQQQDVDPASSGLAALMNDVAAGHQHVLLVSGALDVVDDYGDECALSDGDALALRDVPPADATAANMVVLASKGGAECQRNSVVAVPLDSLQEMQNNLRQSIDQGLQELQNNQGKNGIPAAPNAAAVQPAVYTTAAPPDDNNAANELQQQAQQADQVEQQNVAALQQSGGAPAPATIALGQTIGQVEQAMGQPKNKAIVGSKVIYNYDNLKITFRDGVVTNVE
jgi:hypothetical protein